MPLYAKESRVELQSAEHYSIAPQKAKLPLKYNDKNLRQKGMAYLASGQRSKAIETFRKLVALEQKCYKDKPEILADAYHNLADCYFQNQQYDLAEKNYRRTIATFTKDASNKSMIADSYLSLAKLQELKGNNIAAADYYKTALNLSSTFKHANAKEIWIKYSKVLKAPGRNEEAKAAEKRVRQ